MSELDRIRDEYNRRSEDTNINSRYSIFNEAQLFFMQTRERLLLKMLKKYHLHDFSQVQTLNVGCGGGYELLNLTEYGIAPKRIFGAELMSDRVQQAKLNNSDMGITQADGGSLPFPTAKFDIVFQFGVLTSILDPVVKQRLADEMLRVVKPQGAIIWYDFWANNPRNPNVRGIKRPEIRSLFPGCTFDFNRITLAPPIARTIVPISWLLAEGLAKLPWLLSHYLVVIQKKSR